MRRRRFLELLGAAAAGAIALPYVPQKLYFVGGWPGAGPQIATYGDLTVEQREFYSRELIKRLLPNLPLEPYLARLRMVDTGKSIQFRRWGELAVPSWPAEMAIRPRSEVTALLAEYGSWRVPA